MNEIEIYDPYSQSVTIPRTNASYIYETYIDSVEIRSPYIAGNNGYIGGTFKVGVAGIVIDGINKIIKSSNYSLGVAGWQIGNSGNAEFNNATIRGSITITGSSSGYSNLTDKPDLSIYATTSGLGDLAYQDLVGIALLNDTVIVGGYIKTTLINAGAILIGSLSGAGTLAGQSSVDWTTQVTSKPSLGALAALNSVNATYIDDGSIVLTKLGTAEQIKLNNGDTAHTSTSLWKYPASTLIDGGNIYTGTITANKINVTDLFAQNLSVTGQLYGAKTTYASTTNGFWLGNDGGTYKFNIGNATDYLKWTGTALDISGKLTTGTGSVLDGSYVTNGTITAGKISVTTLSAITADLGTITAGTITLPSGGHIKGGQTAYNTGTGFYLGNDSGTPKFSIGNPISNNVTWDGVNLSINGTLYTTSGSNINASYITNVSALSIGSLSGNLDSISDGSTYVKTTTNEKTGASRGYNALNSSNRYAQWLSTNDFVSGTTPTTGIIMDSTGIKGYYASDKKFEIKTSDGTAFFKGDIYAVNGTFTGSITSTATITGGVLQTASSGARIELGVNGIRIYESSATYNNGLRVRIAHDISGAGYPGIGFWNEIGSDCGNIRGIDSLESIFTSDGLMCSKSFYVRRDVMLGVSGTAYTTRIVGKLRIPVGTNLY